ncbi:hypothetical protein [Streptomyces sp. NPDC004682]
MANRCRAAHPDDPTPCVGAHDAVTVLDRGNAGATGCEHHAARLLASLTGGRVFSGPKHEGAAIRVHKAACGLTPFAWYEDAPRHTH